MLNLQTLLQKKKGQNTAENNRCTKRARQKKLAVLSMAAVGMIPFLAPPVGTDSSVFALAAAAGSIDRLSGKDGPAVTNALVAAVIAENEEAARVTKAHMADSAQENILADSYRVAAGYAARTWKGIAQNIRENLLSELEDELLLLGLGGEDALSEHDVVIGAGSFGAVAEAKDHRASETVAEEADAAPGVGKASEEADAAPGVGKASEEADAAPGVGKASGKEDAAPGVGKASEEADATPGAGKASEEADATPGVGKASGKEDAAPGTDKASETSDANEADVAAAEETFRSKLAKDIPAALSVKYNAGYTALKLSAEQLTVLETIVEAEAGDEDVYGKILVANVVLNRVLDEEFPNTVKEVVFQNNGKTYQFSPVRKGGRYYTVKVSKHTQAAVARALQGEDYSEGALYFFARRYTSAKKAKWFDTALKKIVEYGCHEFFGNK